MARQTVEIVAVDKTARTLGQINNRLANVDRNAKNISTTFGRIAGLAGAVFAGLGLAKVASGVVNVARRFEDLRAQLKTVTGSIENAAVAFEAIQGFAATTPFTVDEITNSFVILKRFGIDATIPSLKAFGNIAAANNRTFTQFAEAVADALTGEFERLKEFGIKVSRENDKFVARLGDQQLGVANSSEELIAIIRQLGEEGGRFGTGIEDRAKTLSGALSNLQDSTDAFSDAIGEGGLNESLGQLAGTLSDSVRSAIPLAQAIGANLAVAVDTVNALFTDFDGTLKSFSTTTQVVLSGVAGLTVALGAGGAVASVNLLKKAFLALGAVMRRNPIGLVITLVASLAAYLSMQNGLGRTVAQVSAVFDKFGEIASGVGKFLKENFNKIIDTVTGAFDNFINSVIDGINAVAEFLGFDKIIVKSSEEIRKAVGDVATGAYVSLKGGIEDAIEVGKEFVDEQITQDGVVKDLVDTWTEAGQAYDNATVAEEALGETTKTTSSALEDQEAKLKKQQEVMGKTVSTTEQLTKAQEKLSTQIQTVGFQSQADALINLKKAYDQALKDQADYLEDNVKVDGDFYKQKELLEMQYQENRLKIIADYDKKISDLRMASIERDIAANQGAIAQQISAMDKEFLQRKGMEERQQRVVRDRIEFEKKSETEKAAFALGKGKEIFEGLGKYSKKAFQAAKAFAIAEAIINTYQGATKALATYPPPFNFIAAAAVVAGGLAQVATIRSQNPTGFARGGDPITNRPAIVGENGPELIVPRTPSTVIPNEVATAIDKMGGGNNGPVNVNFNITTTDARGFDSLLVERRSTIVGIINQAMNSRGKAGVTV